MAIAFTELTGGNDNANASSYDTASISPPADTIIYAAVATGKFSFGTAPLPSMSGNSLTWTQMDTRLDSFAAVRITWFRAVGASPTAGVATISASGCEGIGWTILQATGTLISGTNGSDSVINDFTSAGSSSSPTITLDPFSGSGNATIGAFVQNSGSATFTAGSGFSNFPQQQASDGLTMMVEYRSDNDTTVDITSTVNTRWAVAAFEVVTAGATLIDPMGRSGFFGV